MSGAQEADGASVETGPTSAQELYREKPASTVVRVLTVLAYLLSVSLAAILLSVYYICVWKSPVLPKANELNAMYSSRQGDHNEYDPAFTYDNPSYNFTGGSNTQVNQTATPPVLDDFVNATTTNETVEATIDFIENSTLYTTDNNEISTDNDAANDTTIT